VILIDFSSVIHRKIHTAISQVKPDKIDGKYITKDFIGLIKYYILQDLFTIKQEHSNNFGVIVICLDESSNGYWRKDIYHGYKFSRKPNRDKSEIDYVKIFGEVEKLIEQIKQNLPWKVVQVPRAEADDIMLVLAKEFNNSEKILIHSPDKDMIQAQCNNDNVFQYSSLTRQYIIPENKHDNMEQWLLEHICLGDASDEIPKVVDHTEFSDSFLEFLEKYNLHNIKTPMDFKDTNNISYRKKVEIIENFNVYKLNRKKESIGIKDIYKNMKFGPVKLKKKITKFGGLNNWLDSNPLYRKHYERNFKLIMAEGIPSNIWNEIIINFKDAPSNYNDKDFEKYLIENGLKSILLDLPGIFKVTRELTADDFAWD